MKRLAIWVIVAAGLVGLGVLIHAGAPPTPRWRVRATLDGAALDRQSRLTADGRVLVLTGRELQARDSATGALLLTAAVPGPEALLFSRSGRWALCLRDGTRPWWIDTATGVERSAAVGTQPGPYTSFGMTEDERHSHTINDGRLTVLDLTTGETALTIPCPGGYAIAAGGRLFVAHGKQLALWDIAARRAVATLPMAQGFGVSADGTRALVGETKGYSLFDLTDPAR
ncbi:MAG: YncE family protein, partial [Gemmataceae bacterium]